MKYFKKIIALYSLFIMFTSCSDNKKDELPSANNVKGKAESLFDQASGEEVFNANCVTCHSLRYIEMQPAFPRKTWEKIVDKMKKNFGAPIPDSSVKVIVDYLVSIKGKHE